MTILHLLPYAATLALPVAMVIERFMIRGRAQVNICGICRGFGNRSARSDDTQTVCHNCQGTGWTNSKNLLE